MRGQGGEKLTEIWSKIKRMFKGCIEWIRKAKIKPHGGWMELIEKVTGMEGGRGRGKRYCEVQQMTFQLTGFEPGLQTH